MTFKELQDELRRCCLNVIREGRYSGQEIARRAGFRQAHLSNFLHKRRGLSIDAMDNLLGVLSTDVIALVPEAALRNRIPSAGDDQRHYHRIPLVEVKELSSPQPSVLEFLKFRKPYLRQLQSAATVARRKWTRFVLVRCDDSNAAAMFPRFSDGALLLVDRHYNSLRPHRRGDQNVYAVRTASATLFRYIEVRDSQVILRPQTSHTPLELLARGTKLADAILGRVCRVMMEL